MQIADQRVEGLGGNQLQGAGDVDRLDHREASGLQDRADKHADGVVVVDQQDLQGLGDGCIGRRRLDFDCGLLHRLTPLRGLYLGDVSRLLSQQGTPLTWSGE